MNILSPTKLRDLCYDFGLSPSKKYGQNYLISDAPIKKMIEAGELSKKDVVVEIGPGFGVLTLQLATSVKKVIAFEIEKKIKPYWDQKQKEFSNIEIVWGNALKELKDKSEKLKGEYKVIANLPYQITSNILRNLLELENKPEKIIVMVQKEVAERICAKPGDMSLLSVSVQYYGEPKIVTKVPKGNFWPMPKVDSAVLMIDNIRKNDNKFSDEEFFNIVKAGFASKRKQLWKNLSVIKNDLKISPEDLKKNILDITKNEKIRAEDLSVGQWSKLCVQLFKR